MCLFHCLILLYYSVYITALMCNVIMLTCCFCCWNKFNSIQFNMIGYFGSKKIGLSRELIMLHWRMPKLKNESNWRATSRKTHQTATRQTGATRAKLGPHVPNWDNTRQTGTTRAKLDHDMAPKWDASNFSASNSHVPFEADATDSIIIV